MRPNRSPAPCGNWWPTTISHGANEAESIVARCEHIIFSTGQSDTLDVPELVRQSLVLADGAAGEP